MLGVGWAMVSTPSLGRCPNPQSSPLSLVPAPPLQILRPQRQCSQCVFPGFICSSDSGMRPRFSSTLSNSLQASPYSSSGLSLKKSTQEEAIEEEPSSSSLSFGKQLGGILANPITKEFFSACLRQPAFMRNLGVLWIGSLVLGPGGAALSEIIDVTAPEEGTQPTDYLLSVLFIAAFIGLAILTIGVIYLSVTDFLENRQRNEMQKAAKEEKREKGDDSERVKVGSGKGFGVIKKVEKKTEKGK